MTTKTFEIRDRGTFMPALAIKLDPSNDADRYLLARSGFGDQPELQIVLWFMSGGSGLATCDSYDWPGSARTRRAAHEYIEQHFDMLKTGEVIDVEFILGEKSSKKISESEES